MTSTRYMETKMRLILLLGVILIYTVIMAGGMYSKNITDCSRVSENLNISEVIPIRYDVRIIVKPRQRVLSTYLNILIDVKEPTWNISLHTTSTRGYEADAAPGDEQYKLFEFQYCIKKEILILKFNVKLTKGQYRLILVIRSVLNNNVQNIFYPTTWTTNNQTWLLTNLYTPHAIRSFFPCWDDPRVRASYNISIQFPADYTVLSTVPEKLSSYIQDLLFTQSGIKLTQFKEFISTPTHLVAFLVVGDITIDFESQGFHYIWHKTDADKKFTHVLEIAEMTTAYFNAYMKINISDITPTINHVVLPNSPMKSMGAPGLVVYRESNIMFDKALDFPSQSIDVIMLITYEMARQLFVGIVGPELSANYVWLNEIFASFYGYHIISSFISFYGQHMINKIRTSERLMELFVVKIIQPTLDSDVLLEREPIIYKAKVSNGIDGLLYPLLYHKKAYALIRMLFKLYNPKTFKDAIRIYVYERVDVWIILENLYSLKFESDYTVKEFMNSWLAAKHHPELLIQRDYEKWTAACISSRTFIDDNSKWIIPVNYFTESNYASYNISEVLWLNWGKIKHITAISSDDFLIVNTEQIGYYRVNYDNRNWLLISNYLQKNNFSHIPPINRAQLINDAYYFTTMNQLPAYIFVNITKHLKKDTDFVAWYPMLNILTYMSTYFELSESNRIKEHFVELLGETIRIIEYEDRSWDNNMRKSLRYLTRKWACKFGHAVCRNTAYNRLMYYTTDKNELYKIPATSKEWILCDGVKIDDLNTWEMILNKSMHYTELLEYLPCTENSTIILYFLKLIIRTTHFSGIKQSMGPICRNIVKKHVRRSPVLEFVIDNFGIIQNRFQQDFPPGVLLSDIIMNIYSMDDLNMIEEHASKCTWLVGNASTSFKLLIKLRRAYLRKVLSKFQMFHNPL
ncbi:glutamyl aminopeptidase-like isoform X2 [Odontomachus brunneus]|uniref:glutamyl aminopeptidase-like isoform X2 n=1 Tax=Odontomachus brunneus TaxID=486640 RepID=UPI0013F278FF|nr:glutamyl aminopeptidase-like isoform X2 [Odontomachus brunneus]